MRMQISCSPVFSTEKNENQIEMNSNPHEPGALTSLDTCDPISSGLTLAISSRLALGLALDGLALGDSNRNVQHRAMC